MANAKLKIVEAGKEPRELEIFGDITTFGRTADNSVSFSSDGNVSRYHAQIERRGEEFFVSDFGSSNGTTVNGEPVSQQPKRLQPGDKIVFGGGESHVIFNLEDEELEQDSSNYSTSESPSTENPHSALRTPQSNGFPAMLTAAAVLGGLAVVAVVVVGVVLLTDIAGAGSCTAEVAILSPESGATISEATEIKVNVKNGKCIERVAYLLDGEEIASAETTPYSVTLEPDKFEQFKDDDLPHVLTVAVYDTKGEKKLQKDELNLSFIEEQKKGGKGGEPPPGASPTPGISPGAPPTTLSIAETKTLVERLLKQYPGGFAYKFDPQFLREVQRRTAEYKSEGFSTRAAQYRDQINQAFVAEQGLDVPFGYMLAMSRSRFENKKNGADEGLWQMSNEFAAGNGYNGQCGAETLSDAKQNCAARAAAIYTKALMNLFQNDLVYAVSCYGLAPADAGQFQVTLPPDRSDFWNVIKSPKQREAVARFFAAGIVAENPEKFGLRRDKPLSNLYKNLVILK